MQTNDSNPTRRVHNFGCTKSKALGGPGTPGSCWCDATPQPERFDEFTGGYDDVDHARAAKRINADIAMWANYTQHNPHPHPDVRAMQSPDPLDAIKAAMQGVTEVSPGYFTIGGNAVAILRAAIARATKGGV